MSPSDSSPTYPKDKSRSDLHPLRNIWHVSGVLALLGIFYFLPEPLTLIVLVQLWLLAISIDFLRQRFQNINSRVLSVFRPLMRDEEIHGLAGTSFLLTGVLLTVLFFPREVVFNVLLFLAFADPVASFFGIKFGKTKILKRKSLEGSGAAYLVCFFISMGYLSFNFQIPFFWIFLLSLAGGIIGALSELITFKHLDDNLSFPILSGLGLTLLWQISGLV